MTSAATCVGARARQILSPGARGQVLAGRSQAVYLRSSSGELLWLAPPEVPRHRRGIRVAIWPACPSSGGSYSVTEKTELLAPGLRLDLMAAPTWDPAPPRRRLAQSAANRLGHLRLPQAILSDLPAPCGFGGLLAEILGASGHVPPQPGRGVDASIGSGGVRAALAVALACQEGDLPRMLLQARGLVGLGDGLTPSGDDFLGGALFGLAALTPHDGEDVGCRSTTIREFIQWTRQQTNEISRQLLADHAEGYGCEVLEDFALGLLERRPVRAVLPIARALIGLGHSTGWSLMAGVWTALALFPTQQAQAPELESSAGIPALV